MLRRVYTSAGPPMGDQASDQPWVGWKRCDSSSSSSGLDARGIAGRGSFIHSFITSLLIRRSGARAEMGMYDRTGQKGNTTSHFTAWLYRTCHHQPETDCVPSCMSHSKKPNVPELCRLQSTHLHNASHNGTAQSVLPNTGQAQRQYQLLQYCT
jgi:hypothetical protein